MFTTILEKDHASELDGVQMESQNFSALFQIPEVNSIGYLPISPTTINHVVDTLSNNINEIKFLHFSGHGNADSIILTDGQAHSTGFFEILSESPNLIFLFLNACQTNDFINKISKTFIPCTIAAVGNVNDYKAAEFSFKFYYYFLRENLSLEESFNKAVEFIKLSSPEAIGEIKNGLFSNTVRSCLDDVHENSFTWILNLTPGYEFIRNFTFEQLHNEKRFQSNFHIKNAFCSIFDYVKDKNLLKDINPADIIYEADKLSIINENISEFVNEYPVPISNKLGLLIDNAESSSSRLRQIQSTYISYVSYLSSIINAFKWEYVRWLSKKNKIERIKLLKKVDLNFSDTFNYENIHELYYEYKEKMLPQEIFLSSLLEDLKINRSSIDAAVSFFDELNLDLQSKGSFAHFFKKDYCEIAEIHLSNFIRTLRVLSAYTPLAINEVNVFLNKTNHSYNFRLKSQTFKINSNNIPLHQFVDIIDSNSVLLLDEFQFNELCSQPFKPKELQRFLKECLNLRPVLIDQFFFRSRNSSYRGSSTEPHLYSLFKKSEDSLIYKCLTDNGNEEIVFFKDKKNPRFLKPNHINGKPECKVLFEEIDFYDKYKK